MTRTLAIVSLLCAGCGSDDGGDDGGDWELIGECDPPAGATDVAATAIDVYDSCYVGTANLQVATSEAEWNALFDCPEPVPPGIDFASHRVAVINEMCTRHDHRFTAESSDELVVGVFATIGGACLDNVLVVPLQASAKPIRLAQCRATCDVCPPAP